jgi:hypothetical protein
MGDKVYRSGQRDMEYWSQVWLRTLAHNRKCLQNDELIEYAFPAATSFISPLLPLLARLV